MSNRIENESLPFVSVIMPVYNESSYIERSLGAVLAQTYPAERMEVVIADGMSTDQTRSIINTMAEKSAIPVRIVDNVRKIAPTGMNAAIDASRGDIVVRIDGHCEVEPNYVELCVKYLASGHADGVGGPIETIASTSSARAIATAMSSKFGVGGSAFRTIKDREMLVDTVAFPGYTREIIRKAGRYNEELVRNQDDEYNFRIRKLGGRILLAPDIKSKYYSRSTFWSLWRQYFQYGYWKVRVWQLHPKQMSWRQFVPMCFVLSILFAVLAAFFSTIGKVLLATVLTGYFLANVAASLLTAGRDVSLVPKLSLSFAILHFSYGLGFLKGLAAFFGKWFEKSRDPLIAEE